MGRQEALSSRERVRLALEHQETDRIPIAMVCSGINAPAYREFDILLRQERGLSTQAYLDSLLDIKTVAPEYVGPTLVPGEDIWGVRREPMSYGSGSYHEIDFYPLHAVTDVGELENHIWPSTIYFDYSTLPERAAVGPVISAGRFLCLI